MRAILISFSVLFTFALSAQTTFDNSSFNDFRLKVQQGKFADEEGAIEGSRYFVSDFVMGSVLMADSTFYDHIPLRYDACDDALQTTYNDQIFIIPSGEEMIFASIGEDTLVAVQYQEGNKTYWGNMYLLSSGPVSLYMKRRKSFQKAIEAKGYQDPSPAQYTDDPIVLFWTKGEPILQEVLGKKDVIDFLSEIDAKAYIKKEKLSIRKTDDLIQLVNYYNSNLLKKK